MDPSALIPGEWAVIFKGTDIAVMVMIGVVAYVLTRAAAVSDNLSMLIPLGLGAVWGAIDATQAGYAPMAMIAKGVLMNGGGACVVGRLLHTTGVLDKLWPPAPPKP